MKRIIAAAFSLLLLGVGGTALAQGKVIHEADRTVYKTKTVIDFNEVSIDGELARPEGSYMPSKNKAKFNDMVKTRGNFMPELQKSVDNL